MAARKRAKDGEGFTDDERAAMRERARELRAAKAGKGDGEADVLAKLAEMASSDRAMGERIHAIVREHAPSFTPKLWYGMPAYARDGAVVCFFQGAQKFKTRYCTFGFTDKAALDEGEMWPTGFAIAELTAAVEARIATLVRRAVG